MATNTHEDDNWVKGFFLLMPSKEQEASTLIDGDFFRAQNPSHLQEMQPFPIFDSSILGGDCMTNGR